MPAPKPAAPLRILGVDPGTIVLGWGVIESAAGRVQRIASGTLRCQGARADRLAAICDAMQGLCEEHRPHALSLEQTFVGDNVQSAFRLGEARGAVMVAASRARLTVAEYSPAQIKVAVAGSGRASKPQMQLMVGRLLAVAEALAEDEADALGAALCHLHAGQFGALLAQAGAGGLGGATLGRARGGRGSWRNFVPPAGRR
ncbi:MAG: crossover junction endodeoxyribonuclease RuvC [Deltaproteobacteria bacterium]|nr:crossover junction endodeoxyribonuclease RuvC [Deltaproteobacteria bacterium]